MYKWIVNFIGTRNARGSGEVGLTEQYPSAFPSNTFLAILESGLDFGGLRPAANAEARVLDARQSNARVDEVGMSWGV